MMTLIFLLLNLLIILSSLLATSRINYGQSLSERTITTFLFVIAQITISVLFLGAIIQSLTPTSLVLLNTVFSSLLILIYRKKAKAVLSGSYTGLLDFLRFVVTGRDYFLYFFLLLFLFQVAATCVKIYYLPPFVGDVFSYHLHPVVDWFQQGKIISLTNTPVSRAIDNPLGAKFLHLWFVIFVGDITWIEVPQFLFGIILSLTVYAMLLKMNLQRKNALRYGMLVYFIPTVLLQSRTCQDHLIFAACIFMVLNYLMDVLFRDRHGSILPLFMTLGVLFSIKKHSLLVIGVLLVTVLLSRGFNGRGLLNFITHNRLILIAGSTLVMGYGCYFFIAKKQLYEGIWSRYSKEIPTPLIFALLLAVLLVPLLWRITRNRNLHVFFEKRRLILPIAAGIALLLLGGTVIINRQVLAPFFLGTTTPIMLTNRSFSTQYPAINNYFLKNLAAFPFRLKDLGLYIAYTPDLLEQSGFGMPFFTFGIIAYLILIPLCIFKKAYRNSIMGFLLIFSVLLLAVYFCFYFSWANYRSFLFFAVIGLMGWCFLLEKLALKRIFLIYIDGLLVVMMLFSAASCFFEGNMSPLRWKTLFTIENQVDRTSIKYATLIGRSVRQESWEFIDRFLRPEEAVGFSGGGAAYTFPYFDYQLKRHIYFLKTLPGFSISHLTEKGITYNMLTFSAKFREALKQRGIHYLHLNNEGATYKEKLFMPEGMANVTRVTQNLYYIK